jgi:DNA topoisomerase I
MSIPIFNKKIYKQIISSPKLALDQLDLVYVSEEKLPILRTQEGEAFTYVIKGRPIKQKHHLKRIGSLVLPPAWKEVKITDIANGHLQAVGLDNKNRKQYRYHPKWTQIRNQTKFYKMAAFGKSLPLIRKQIDEDLGQKEWTRDKVSALVIRLMEETHIRIGNERYAKENKSYGLSTLRKRHVNIDKNFLRLEFVGKKGKKHTVTLKNKKLIRLVSHCEEIPGREVFKYYDENGERKVLDSTIVNNYLHTITGDNFSSKDFRTWLASLIFFEALKDFGISTDPKEIQKNILSAYDQTATALGNTRNVCKSYYVHPLLVSQYEDGSINRYFKKADRNNSEDQYLSSSEVAVLNLIGKFNPDFS